MKFNRIAPLFCAAAVMSAGPVLAAGVGIGTTKGGATAQVSAGLSKIVSSHAGFQMRPQPMGGTQQYIPIVNAGELDFGISNAMQASMAINGTGMSEGKKYSNLQLVSTLMTFKTGVLVRADSNIKSIGDLKGMRVPGKFSASPLFKHLMGASLANAGLGWGDVKMVPQVGLRQSWDAFMKGKVDAAYAAVGSGITKKLNATVKGIRFMSLDTSDAARKRLLSKAPETTIKVLKPAKPFVGITGPSNILHFAYLLWTHKGASDDAVYKVVKAIYDNEKEVHGLGPLWRSHKSKTMGAKYGPNMNYHPAAIKFYKEKGVW